MKKYFDILLLMVFTINTYSQLEKNIGAKFSSENYLKKSKKHLKTGVILLGGGVAMFAGGTYLSAHGSCSCKDPFPVLLMAGGIGMAVTSIPFFISSASNKRKANLYMKREALLLAPGIRTGVGYNSVGIRIDL